MPLLLPMLIALMAIRSTLLSATENSTLLSNKPVTYFCQTEQSKHSITRIQTIDDTTQTITYTWIKEIRTSHGTMHNKTTATETFDLTMQQASYQSSKVNLKTQEQSTLLEDPREAFLFIETQWLRFQDQIQPKKQNHKSSHTCSIS